ncbi:MAG TPA: aspartate--tRNA ligase [Thermotogaceae bacterium]|nr:aspartate--tRNA ligase [Thermotogota bacterium]HEW92490.1 aspartate--tRNA ligase [Thermotogaceae bacterium]
MLKRTHNCGELRKENVGERVILNGWVDRRRDLGGIIFITLRDRYGLTQIVFNPGTDVYELAKNLGGEYVIGVEGMVRERPADATNPSMPTGEIEVLAEKLEVFSSSKVTPIYTNRDDETSEEMRLKYRYLDLRRPNMKENIIVRHRIAQIVRDYLNSLDFIEIETPILTKSTPEGARDFLVPSRLKKGKFYALPQSPQLFKQLLMIAGFDKYYQLARCFRDEDFRADRQPEFTQIDVEMSFVDRDEVLEVAEGLFVEIFKKVLGVTLKTPFRRYTYNDVMESYGSDKPDTRYGMKFVELNDIFEKTEFRAFREVIENSGVVKGFFVDEIYSRKEISNFENLAKSYGSKGLAWFRFSNGEVHSPILKFLKPLKIEELKRKFDIASDGTVFVVADDRKIVNTSLGAIRSELIKKKGKIQDSFDVFWVIDFPMFEWDEEENRFVAAHHPFTMPYLSDLERYKDGDLSKVRAQSYDLVINGYEILSGSIRIHKKEIQERVFDILKISKEEAKKKFGFLLEAFEYGAPPHGGFAVGFDRLVAIIRNVDSIRDVIAFPKTATGADIMTGAPSEVNKRQLDELGIEVKLKGDT